MLGAKDQGGAVMTRRLSYGVIGIAAGLAVVVGIRSSAAQNGDLAGGQRFDNRTVKGFWGFNSPVGYVVPPATPQPVPFVGLGRIFFDGEGGCAVQNVVNFSGQISRFKSATCHYSVTPDGFGTAEADFPDAPVPGPVPLAFIIVDHGRELRAIDTNFIVTSFSALRQ
jgi:hypothetical protein